MRRKKRDASRGSPGFLAARKTLARNGKLLSSALIKSVYD